jgi:ATP-dependent RNA helicase RhlE
MICSSIHRAIPHKELSENRIPHPHTPTDQDQDKTPISAPNAKAEAQSRSDVDSDSDYDSDTDADSDSVPTSGFAALGLNPALVRAVRELGFVDPTPIQKQAIPAVLEGRDVMGAAQTGSGKTAAFALPLLQRLSARDQEKQFTARKASVLVLVPTRELAAQVGEVFRSLAQYLSPKLKTAVVFGGVSINPQMMALRGGADIVIATPGRLLDLVNQNALKLAWVQTLVLDEADRLLDLGFAEELDEVLKLLPSDRQNLFFSATFPEAVDTLVGKLLRDPIRIEIDNSPQNEPIIEQRVFHVDENQRTQLLVRLFKENNWDHVLVFAATQYATSRVAEKLQRAKIYATAFHGGLSQGARTLVMDQFKANRWQVVVTTDLAARGIHIPKLPVVVNYDLPRSVTDYTHRIGRTGRAGESGLAVSFVSSAAEAHFRLIEKHQGLSLPREIAAGFEPSESSNSEITNTLHTELPGNDESGLASESIGAPGTTKISGGIKGKRPNKKDKLRAAAKELIDAK